MSSDHQLHPATNQSTLTNNTTTASSRPLRQVSNSRTHPSNTRTRTRTRNSTDTSTSISSNLAKMPLTNSPMSSPSLRAIAQAHAHARTSYFPTVPNAAYHAVPHSHQYGPRTPANSMNVHTSAQTYSPHSHSQSASSTPVLKNGSPLIGCLKNSGRNLVASPASEVAPPSHSYYTSAAPSAVGSGGGGGYAQSAMRSTNPAEKRRASMGNMGNLKVSQIPLSPSTIAHGARQASTFTKSAMPPVPAKVVHSNTLDTASRRRPSFKIDLPPRPVPHGQGGHGTPSQLGAYSTSTPTQFVDSPLAHHNAISQSQAAQAAPLYYPSRLAGTPPVFRDPFAAQAPAHEGGYIILRAPSHRMATPGPGMGSGMNTFFNDFPSPTQQPAEEIWPGMVGLGYSLNRLRAPTPWLRDVKGGEMDGDEEWIRAGDLDNGAREVEGRMRGLGVA